MNTTIEPIANVYPLIVSGRDWSIEFQSAPVQQVIRRGRVPTEAEVLVAFAAWPLASLLLVQILPIIAASVPDSGQA